MGRRQVNGERDAQFVALFKAGHTQPEIAALFGLRRSRVATIIRAAGVDRYQGGKGLRASRAKQRRVEQQNKRMLKAYGCDYETALALNGGARLRESGSLAYRYHAQRTNAGKRGIGWEFTFPAWVATWEASGRLHQRGKCRDGYVMARHGDTGPYSPANVYITTLSQNFLDYHAKAKVEGYPCFERRRAHTRSLRAGARHEA
jgi:hypothetical protein